MLPGKPRPLLHHNMGNKRWVKGLGQPQAMLQVSRFTSKLLVAMALGALLLSGSLGMLQWHQGHDPPALPVAGRTHGADPTSFGWVQPLFA